MNAFLAESLQVFQNLVINPFHYNNLKVVLCNETCDLDSVISCLVYGFALYHEGIQDFHAKYVVLPLLNVTDEDFKTKTEVIHFLNENGIDIKNVPTRGVPGLLNLEVLQDAAELELYLVDHHVMLPNEKIMESSVVEVIDHRPRDPNSKWENVENVTIENVGSCATLIAQKIRERVPYLLTKEIASLLLGPILLDTVNLSESAGRATPLDHEMASYLEKISPIDRQALFQSLVNAKTDIKNLTTLQIFKKDLKVVLNVPVIGVPCLLNDLIKQRNDFSQTLTEFSKGSILILLGSFIQDEIMTRDLAIYGKDVKVEKIINCLFNCELDLKLTEILNHNVPFLKLFKQGNNKITRKHLTPILINILKE